MNQFNNPRLQVNMNVSEATGGGESNEQKFNMSYLTTTDSIPLRHSTWTIVILLAAYLTVGVAGLIGNVLVILVVLKMSKMKTATNTFILNLAIADLLVLIFCLVPTLISNIYVPWVMGKLMCKAVPYIQGVAVCASVYSLAAISGERLMAVRFPLRRQVTKTVARWIIVLIWMWGAALALPWLLYFDLSNPDGGEPSLVFCIESWPTGMNENLYFALVNLGLFYLFPLGFISCCHLSIWLRVRHRHVPTDSSVSQMELVHRQTKASVQKLVIVVVTGFALCWLPLYVIFIRIKLIPAELGATEEQVLDYALPVAQWLGAANSCINPIFYGFINRNFRLTLQRILPGLRALKNCPNPQHPYQRAGLRASQHKNPRGTAVEPTEFSLVKLRQNVLPSSNAM